MGCPVSDVVTDVPDAPYATVPASRAVAVDGPFLPRGSWWSRLLDRVALRIPEGHPDQFGSLDRRERGLQEFDRWAS